MLISVHPRQKFETFFSCNFRIFTCPHTPGSMMRLHHWWGFVDIPSCFASSLNRRCGVAEKKSKKFFQTFGHGWKVGWPKVTYHLTFFDVVRKSKIWNFENEYFGFRMVATTVTLRPPSRWCSGGTPPQGGQLGRGPDEKILSPGPESPEKSISSYGKTWVNAMFFRVKRLPPGGLLPRLSTVVDRPQQVIARR